MSLLSGGTYDPTTAVTKATSAALVMTALDTTNLRRTFVAPTNGTVLIRMSTLVHGATTYPAILLGVLSGTTVMGRVAPNGYPQGMAASATAFVGLEAMFTVAGLTPAASYTFDAAYAVETGVTSTAIKYGGPNNTTANDAFGGFVFEVWDTV